MTLDPTQGQLGLGAGLLTAAIVIGLGVALRKARRRAEASAREAQLEQRRLQEALVEGRAAASALRAKDAELRLVTSRTPVLLVRCSRDRRYLFVNRAAAEFLERPVEELIGRSIAEVLGAEASRAIEPFVERVLCGQDVEFELDVPYQHAGVRCMHVMYTPDRDERGEIVGWLASIQDVTRAREAERAQRRNEAQLAAEASALARLNEGSARLWRAPNLRVGLDEMLATSIDLLGADMGNVQLLDVERELLTIAAHRGFRDEFLESFRVVSTADESACGRALRGGRQVVIEDVEADAAYEPLRPVARKAGYRAVVSTPLASRDGQVLGMLSVHFREVHRPEPQELRRLELFVRLAADFVLRCRMDESLREADRRKDEFLATLAHELRNPLAPVWNAVQLLRLKEPGRPDEAWAHDVIDRQMQQMARLIDDLMDISRITRGRIELRRERVELAVVLQAAVETSRPLAEAAGQRLDVVLPPQSMVVDGDRTRLAQVFSNLLNNAAKYSEPGGRIDVSVTAEGGEAVVTVRDEGMGIPAGMLPRIFEPFTQVNRSLERSQGGLGIGLALVKSLVELHGGRVEARSNGVGHGSEFRVRLPLAAPGAPPRAAVSPGSDALQAPGSCRVLVVDDNADAALSLALVLEALGYETRTANDGRAGLAAAEEFRPDVALLDIGMPEMNGYELAACLRREEWGRGMALVAVTGWGQPEDKQRTRSAGFDHHLVKPVEPSVLAQLLVSLTRVSPTSA